MASDIEIRQFNLKIRFFMDGPIEVRILLQALMVPDVRVCWHVLIDLDSKSAKSVR